MPPWEHQGIKTRRILLMVFYEGPWERLQGLLLGVRSDPGMPLRWEVGHNPTGLCWVAGKAAEWCETRDYVWRERYARNGKKPRDRWRRSHHDDAEA
jgi:hypothetical protein